MAPRYIGRPQKALSNLLWMLTCLMYFVSLGGSIGGMVLVSEIGAESWQDRHGLLRVAVQVAGLAVPVLTFALIHGEFERAAVGAMKGLVDVEHGLDGIVARREGSRDSRDSQG